MPIVSRAASAAIRPGLMRFICSKHSSRRRSKQSCAFAMAAFGTAEKAHVMAVRMSTRRALIRNSPLLPSRADPRRRRRIVLPSWMLRGVCGENALYPGGTHVWQQAENKPQRLTDKADQSGNIRPRDCALFCHPEMHWAFPEKRPID